MGHSLKLKCSHSPLNLRILSSTCVPFTLTSHDGASVKFGTNSHETDYSVVEGRSNSLLMTLSKLSQPTTHLSCLSTWTLDRYPLGARSTTIITLFLTTVAGSRRPKNSSQLLTAHSTIGVGIGRQNLNFTKGDINTLVTCVSAPDSGSGAFLTPGSGRDPGWIFVRSRISDPNSIFLKA